MLFLKEKKMFNYTLFYFYKLNIYFLKIIYLKWKKNTNHLFMRFLKNIKIFKFLNIQFVKLE